MEETQNIPDSVFCSSNFISLADAEKILKKPVRLLKDSLFKKRADGNVRFQFTYKANSIDSITCLFSALFFGFEQYNLTDEAKRFFTLTRSENEKLFTLYDLKKAGDEAFWGRNENCPFIFIRKNNRIYKLRLLYEMSQASLDELLSLAQKIVSQY